MKTTHLLTGAALLLAPAVSVASHPERSEMARVQILAHELEEAARHVHRQAERRAHHGWWEERGLRRLHDLEGEARHFHRQVERYRQNPYHTEADFRRLVASYRRAEEAVHGMHGDRHVERDFYRVARLMDELLALYGYGPRYSTAGTAATAATAAPTGVSSGRTRAGMVSISAGSGGAERSGRRKPSPGRRLEPPARFLPAPATAVSSAGPPPAAGRRPDPQRPA